MYIEVKAGSNTYSVVYEKARRPDGSLFFPQRLTEEFLDEQRRVLGPYIFANQYMNEIIPGDEQDFKKAWIKYYDQLPARYNTFIFIDPAISLADTADYTAVVVVHVDDQNDWYVSYAQRMRITATETVRLIFKLTEAFKPSVIGIEIVAYQEALMHVLNDEMRRAKVVLPVTGIKRRNDKSKEVRIRALIPRFEWGRIYLKKGLLDLEDEYAKFPRGQYDDVLDALSSIEEVTYPIFKEKAVIRELQPNQSGYESQYIRNLAKKAAWSSQEEDW